MENKREIEMRERERERETDLVRKIDDIKSKLYIYFGTRTKNNTLPKNKTKQKLKNKQKAK